MNNNRPYNGVLVNSFNEARPVSATHRQPYQTVESYLLDRELNVFTELDIEKGTNLDRKVIRSCLHRLEFLNVIKKIGYQKTGERGRPARIWVR